MTFEDLTDAVKQSEADLLAAREAFNAPGHLPNPRGQLAENLIAARANLAVAYKNLADAAPALLAENKRLVAQQVMLLEAPDKASVELVEVRSENARLRAVIVRLRLAMEKLACLGNGDRHDNSIGNRIAQDAPKKEESRTECPICRGTGKNPPDPDDCSRCDGKGWVT